MPNSLPTYTAFCKHELADDFTGVLYSDIGRLNYAAVLKGKILQDRRRRNRWFASAEAAQIALNGVKPL